jgi:hypothetical protein
MTLADMDGNESFDPANLGTAEEVAEESVSDNDMLMVRGPKNTRAVTGEGRGRGWEGGGGWHGRGGVDGRLVACGMGQVGSGLSLSRHSCFARWYGHISPVPDMHSPTWLDMPSLPRCAPASPQPACRLGPAHPQCCCAAPLTICWTRWTARCTTPFASSSACWRAGRWWQVRSRCCCGCC